MKYNIKDGIMHKNFKNSGFSLIELIVVLSIISVFSTIAISSFMNWLPNYRLNAAVRELYSNMQKARVEAVKTHQNVLIEFFVGAYTPGGNVGSYRVFVDKSAPSGSYNGGDDILVQVNMPKNVSLYFNSFTGNTAGYTFRSLPWNNNWGSVEFRNNNSRYFQASLSAAGIIKIKKSNDGATWN